MLASKNIRPAMTKYSEGSQWLRVLSGELLNRLEEARETHSTVWPRSLVLHTRQGKRENPSPQSSSLTKLTFQGLTRQSRDSAPFPMSETCESRRSQNLPRSSGKRLPAQTRANVTSPTLLWRSVAWTLSRITNRRSKGSLESQKTLRPRLQVAAKGQTRFRRHRTCHSSATGARKGYMSRLG